jgi:Fe2+ transport system protein FeoA
MRYEVSQKGPFMNMPVPLSQLSTTEDMLIVDINADEASRNRLFSIGFVPGTIVSFLSKTAFGGPLTFKLRGSKIAIRKNDAECILVQVANSQV